MRTELNGSEKKSSNSKLPNTLDPETREFLKQFSKTFATIETLPFPEQRAKIKELYCVPEEQLEKVAKVEDKAVSGRHGPIAIRLFTPKLEGNLPVIVYFHRGGWVYGSIRESEVVCRRLANETGAIVAAVEYRLSPEYKFPIPLEDCYDAAQWTAANASTFRGNPEKIILCGESAGGNLAAVVTQIARQTKHFSAAGQLLIYPCLTSDLNLKDYEESPDKSLLSYENMKFFWEMYLNLQEEGNNPLASPLKSKDFERLPPCFVITAQHDALKHEAISYGEALKKAGVKVKLKNYHGVIHGFLDLPLAEAAKKEAFGDIAEWVKSL